MSLGSRRMLQARRGDPRRMMPHEKKAAQVRERPEV
jgi:hypothetical protein